MKHDTSATERSPKDDISCKPQISLCFFLTLKVKDIYHFQLGQYVHKLVKADHPTISNDMSRKNNTVHYPTKRLMLITYH